MKKIIALSLLLTFLIAGCKSSNKNKVNEASKQEASSEKAVAAQDGHNAQNSLDYYGVYEGITPCADCEGIKVVVTLNKDNTYHVRSVYLKNKQEILPEEFSGKFTWSEDGFKITLEGTGEYPNHFSVKEGSLTILDAEGKEINTELAEHYVLKQIEIF